MTFNDWLRQNELNTASEQEQARRAWLRVASGEIGSIKELHEWAWREKVPPTLVEKLEKIPFLLHVATKEESAAKEAVEEKGGDASAGASAEKDDGNEAAEGKPSKKKGGFMNRKKGK